MHLGLPLGDEQGNLLCGQPQVVRARPITMTARSKPRRHRKGPLIFLLASAAFLLAVLIGVNSGGSSPQTPYQQCVASIKTEPPNQVIGFTPQCMKLTVIERMKAISQVTHG